MECPHGLPYDNLNGSQSLCSLCAGPRDRRMGSHAHIDCERCGNHCGTPYFFTDEGYTKTVIECDKCGELTI